MTGDFHSLHLLVLKHDLLSSGTIQSGPGVNPLIQIVTSYWHLIQLTVCSVRS